MNDNGSVFRRNDGRVYGKYKDADGKWRYIYRKTKTEAKQALREALKDRDAGIVPSNLTVNEVLVRWIQEGKHEVSIRILDNRKSIVRTHFQSHPIGTYQTHTTQPRASTFLHGEQEQSRRIYTPETFICSEIRWCRRR